MYYETLNMRYKREQNFIAVELIEISLKAIICVYIFLWQLEEQNNNIQSIK